MCNISDCRRNYRPKTKFKMTDAAILNLLDHFLTYCRFSTIYCNHRTQFHENISNLDKIVVTFEIQDGGHSASRWVDWVSAACSLLTLQKSKPAERLQLLSTQRSRSQVTIQLWNVIVPYSLTSLMMTRRTVCCKQTFALKHNSWRC